MSNQDKNYKLNPGAVEFVPNFGGAPSASTLNSQVPEQQHQQQFEPVQEQRSYHQPHYNSYNKPHYNSRGGGRGGRNNYNNYNNGHRGGNHYDRPHYSNDPSVDPLEMEARCEAVIEILQDDKIRNVINPNYDNQDSHPGSVANPEENLESQFDDEEDLLEMMAMQEECRLEMMKFYIQSQNPSLFENVYHGVSYPENHVANAPASTSAPPPTNNQPTPSAAPSSNNSSSAPASSATSSGSSVKDQIINDLSINAPEFDPTQLANLSLNDK